MTAKQPFNYQAKTAELESFIAKLESGELDIDEALTAYEAAQKVMKELEAYLKTAENKVKKIKKDSA